METEMKKGIPLGAAFTAVLIVLLLGKQHAHKKRNFLMHKPESRLKSLRGQDRSVNTNLLFENARETDKGCFTFSKENESMIYSPNTYYIQNK